MKLIQVLGTGCPKCRKLEEQTRQAARELGLECEILKVTDIDAILRMGVMTTPGLAVDGRMVLSGKVPSVDELKKLLA
jgi:small redox-active disulfide protein 2